MPIGAVSVLLGRISISETPRRSRRVDRFGQVTAIIAMGLVTAAVIHGGESGWRSPITIGMLVAGLLVGAAFWTAEGRIREPMLPPVFFANRVRTVAVVSASLMGFLFYGTLFLMSLYFQQLRGWSPGSTGVALLPLTVGTLAGPFLIYRRLLRRFGHPVLLVAGFACSALRIAVLAPTDAHSAYGQIRLAAPRGVRRARRRRAPRHRRVLAVARRVTDKPGRARLTALSARSVVGDYGCMTTPSPHSSLKIGGKRIYIWSGEFHYWRLPSPSLWRDVLEKLKTAGYNAFDLSSHFYELRHRHSTSTASDQTHIAIDLSTNGTYTYDDIDPALTYTGTNWSHVADQSYIWNAATAVPQMTGSRLIRSCCSRCGP